jgi:threonine/homoserine/homoserine lactone efflux protein
VPTVHQIVAYAIIVTVVVLIPGPSALFVVTRAVSFGRTMALVSVVGNALGLSVQVALVAISLGALSSVSGVILRGLGLVGGLVLVFLGVTAVRQRQTLAEVVVHGQLRGAPRRMFTEAILVGSTNPKSFAFLVASLSAFRVPYGGDPSLRLLVLGACFPLVALVADSGWALLGGAGAKWLSAVPRRLALIGGVGGVLMVCVGMLVLVQAVLR